MRIIFLLCLIGTVQLYVIGQLRLRLPGWIQDEQLRNRLLVLFTWVCVATLVPLLWRENPRLNATTLEWRDTLFLLSGMWWAGTAGCAVVLFAYSAFNRMMRLVSSPEPAQPPDLQRRAFLQKSVGVAAVAPFMISGYGGLLERRRFEIEHFEVPVSGLSSSLSQLTIVQLSDIHVGPFMSAEELNEYIDAVNRLKPDLVALTGDFVTGSRSEVLPCVQTLRRLQARLGVFACLGNHDIYAGAAGDLILGLANSGIRMLRNDAATIDVGNSTVGVLGIDDLGRGRPSLRRTIDARHRPAEVNVLLSHRPEIFPRAANEGVDLVLSGHYHGGQIKLLPEPQALSIARFMTSYADGFFTLPRSESGDATRTRSTLFVSRGIGVTALPVRVNCPPQIAHLTLRKDKG
ncbi:MAG TPA: metallophosphoesterase [Candidatus Binatia bacterium]|jgi:hypothetical protein